MSNRPRHQYIGSYDAGCILGTNPYRPRIAVWEEKVSTEPRPDISNPHIDRGNTMEPIIEEYMRKHVDPTINSPEQFAKYDAEGKAGGAASGTDNQIFMQHPDLSYVGGHPDGIGEECYYEFKAPTTRKLDGIERALPISYEELNMGVEVTMEDIYKAGVPAYWIIQVQHGLMCTGLPRGELVIWDYDRWAPFRLPITPHPGLHERMLQEYEIFWTCVQLGIQPQGDTDEEIEQLTIVKNDELDALFAEYEAAYRMRYDGKDKQSEFKAKILSLLKGRKTIITPNYVASIAEVDMKTYSYTRLTIKSRDE